MEQSPFSDAERLLADHEIPCLPCSSLILYRIRKKSPLKRILSYLDPFSTLISCLFKIYLIVRPQASFCF
jgi:DNA-directed RNA polymerase subunit RPC12/RpoP